MFFDLEIFLIIVQKGTEVEKEKPIKEGDVLRIDTRNCRYLTRV